MDVWISTRRAVVLSILAVACGSGCRSDPQPPRSRRPAQAPVPATDGGPGDSRTAGVGEGFVGVLLSGEVVDVAPQVQGQIKEVSVRLGDRVKRGQRLASIDERPIVRELTMGRATLSEAKARQTKAGIERERAEQSYDRRQLAQGAVSKETLENAKLNLRAGVAELARSAAEVAEQEERIKQLTEQLARTVLRAPFDGFVALRYVDRGAVVQLGQPIVRLVSNEGYRVRFAVPPRHSAQVAVGRRVRAVFRDVDLTVEGTVTHAAQEVDSAAHMVFVEAALATPPRDRDRLRGGLMARVIPSSP